MSGLPTGPHARPSHSTADHTPETSRSQKTVQDLDPTDLTAECPLRVDTKDEPRPLPDTACPISEREKEKGGRKERTEEGKHTQHNFSFSNWFGKGAVGSNK